MKFIYQTPKHKPETMSTSKLNNIQKSGNFVFKNFKKLQKSGNFDLKITLEYILKHTNQNH